MPIYIIYNQNSPYPISWSENDRNENDYDSNICSVVSTTDATAEELNTGVKQIHIINNEAVVEATEA